MHILYVCVHVHSCVCIHECSFLICQFPNLKVGALILCIKCPVFLSTGADEMVHLVKTFAAKPAIDQRKISTMILWPPCVYCVCTPAPNKMFGNQKASVLKTHFVGDETVKERLC